MVERAGFKLLEYLLASDSGAPAVVASFESVDDVLVHYVGPVIECLERVLYFGGALMQELQMGLPYQRDLLRFWDYDPWLNKG